LPPDPDEPGHVSEAVARLKLKYVVITSVTRDDLADGGAGQFATTIEHIRRRNGKTTGIEVLTPDFAGRRDSVTAVVAARPTVFNHNIETCRRLTPEIRSCADYDRSLQVLRSAVELGKDVMTVKSGLMLGMGEADDEVRETLADLRQAGVTALTVGQYLPPSSAHWPLARYVTPDEFDQWGRLARDEFGFTFVASAPRVRSSYMAEALVER
jgi:lipoic acid synthetase